MPSPMEFRCVTAARGSTWLFRSAPAQWATLFTERWALPLVQGPGASPASRPLYGEQLGTCSHPGWACEFTLGSGLACGAWLFTLGLGGYAASARTFLESWGCQGKGHSSPSSQVVGGSSWVGPGPQAPGICQLPAAMHVTPGRTISSSFWQAEPGAKTGFKSLHLRRLLLSSRWFVWGPRGSYQLWLPQEPRPSVSDALMSTPLCPAVPALTRTCLLALLWPFPVLPMATSTSAGAPLFSVHFSVHLPSWDVFRSPLCLLEKLTPWEAPEKPH